ncbi:hypothetical protein BV898_19408 [Hypsibius exemplaris]|uniref:Uncharacterized protein n=1 Tax=Hypsibius exemplaris TaxID=2072580 RepID=A0A9X6RP40_HYPEX|nr:hypothetical protein BV898_19408 [Hypsibius exemplaris]
MANATVTTIYPNATGGVLEFCIVERVLPPTIPTLSKAPVTRDARRILQIEVLTLIMAFPVRLGALTFTGPAFDQARVDISRAYPYLNTSTSPRRTLLVRPALCDLEWTSMRTRRRITTSSSNESGSSSGSPT